MELAARLKRAPEHAGETFAQRLDHLALRLTSALRDSVVRTERRLALADQRLLPAMEGAFARGERRLVAMSAKLDLLDPSSPLKRGYSLTFDSAGRIVRRADSVKPGDELTTRVGEGQIVSTVSG